MNVQSGVGRWNGCANDHIQWEVQLSGSRADYNRFEKTKKKCLHIGANTSKISIIFKFCIHPMKL